MKQKASFDTIPKSPNRAGLLCIDLWTGNCAHFSVFPNSNHPLGKVPNKRWFVGQGQS